MERINFNNASCNSPIDLINLDAGVYPCDREITWREVKRVVEEAEKGFNGPKRGRVYLKKYRETLPECKRIE